MIDMFIGWKIPSIHLLGSFSVWQSILSHDSEGTTSMACEMAMPPLQKPEDPP